VDPGIGQAPPELRRRHPREAPGIPGQIHCAARSS
jgi:hypothetical protein